MPQERLWFLSPLVKTVAELLLIRSMLVATIHKNLDFSDIKPTLFVCSCRRPENYHIEFQIDLSNLFYHICLSCQPIHLPLIVIVK